MGKGQEIASFLLTSPILWRLEGQGTTGFPLQECEEQALRSPLSPSLFFVAPLPSPGYLQHITPSSCAGLLLSKGIPRGFRGERQQAPQGSEWLPKAGGCRASGGEVLLAGLQTMASPMLL